MEPRTLAISHQVATSAALGLLLLLATLPARADGTPSNPTAIRKCIVQGITSYSDKPCPHGSGERAIAPPSIVASEASRPESHVRSARCEAAEAELHNIDALTRQGQPPDMQAFLEARRQQRHSELFRYRC